MRHVLRRAGLLAALACCAPFALAAAGPSLRCVSAISATADPGPLLSNVIPEPEDAGLRGAELAITDSNSTGRFLKHSYVLDAVTSETSDDLLQQAARQHADGLRLFVVNVPAATLRQLAEAMPDSLLINAGTADDALRSQNCQVNVLHTLPSRNMLADALGQFLPRGAGTAGC